MRRLIYIAALVALFATTSIALYGASTKGRSEHIVYLDGLRYYVHDVVSGDTFYSLSNVYGVSEEQILKSNPTVVEGLKVGESIKIPNLEVVEDGQLSKRSQRKVFDEHVIAVGETLYSISRRYELSIATILEDNPSLDPSALGVGEVVNIRKSQLGLTSQSSATAELNEYRDRLNRVAPKGYRYYIVDGDDTLVSIASESSMSVGQLRNINDLSVDEQLHEGDIILVATREVDPEFMVVADELSVDTLDMEPCFTTLNDGDTLNVLLMLPLQMRGYNMKPFVEFYRGFMLGVEDLQSTGRSVVVNLYNTQRDMQRVEQIMSEMDSMACDLIVGPVYEELLAPVLEYAEYRNVPVVSPLVNVSEHDSPVLFQMTPHDSMRYDKIGELLSPERTITLIYGQKSDTAYVSSIKALLNSSDTPYEEHHYRYEHTSVISDRVKAIEERIEKIEKAAMASYRMPDQRLLDSLHLRMVSSSDLRPVVANEAKYNTFFVMSSDEIEVDRILTSINSASKGGRYTKLVESAIDSTMLVSVSVWPSKYEVVANPAWRRYTNIDHTIYFNNQVVNFSSYLAGRESEAIREFDSRYAQAYDDLATLYAYRGYDVVKIFGEGAYNDIRYGLVGETFRPLQTEYRFDVVDSLSSRRVNQNWMRVNYKPNLKFEIE
ncbi:MAG: LysM peptidoglycan-binding domain-containing protein [Rikenellaceae bacterium]